MTSEAQAGDGQSWGGAVRHKWATPDKEHMVLTTVKAAPTTLSFHRAATPAGIRLKPGGFHLVSE